MSMEYKDIIIKVKKQITEILGSGYSITPAIVKEKEGHKCEVYFAYSGSRKGNISRPYIRLVADYETGVMLEYQNAYYHEFANRNKFPLEGKMNPNIPVAKTACEQSNLLDKLYSLYERVRRFAYSENISDEERKILSDYRKSLYDTIPVDLMEFCFDTENEFFLWMDKAIAK